MLGITLHKKAKPKIVVGRPGSGMVRMIIIPSKDESLFTMEEALLCEIPYLTIKDMEDKDWISLDLQLEKYDRDNKVYDLKQLPVLAFIIEQIRLNSANLVFVPDFIKQSPNFQALL